MCYHYLEGSLFLNAKVASELPGLGWVYTFATWGKKSPLAHSILSVYVQQVRQDYKHHPMEEESTTLIDATDPVWS